MPTCSHLAACVDVLLGEVEAGRLPAEHAYRVVLDEARSSRRAPLDIDALRGTFRLAFVEDDGLPWGPRSSLHLWGPTLPDLRHADETIYLDFLGAAVLERVDVESSWRGGTSAPLASRLAMRREIHSLGFGRAYLGAAEMRLTCLESAPERRQAWRLHIGRGQLVRSGWQDASERHLEVDAFDDDVLMARTDGRGMVLRRLAPGGARGRPLVGPRRGLCWP